MKARYDAVVIGTGFGGSVAACRLAQAGIDVGVFERGHRYPPAKFPRDASDINGGWLWKMGRGLFDIKMLGEMVAVQAAGFGGGSLIYANVHMRPPEKVFASGWPAGYSLNALAPYYDLVGYMMDIKPITAAAALPPKTILMQQAAQQLEREKQFFHPNIAVDLGPKDVKRTNKFGAEQQGCNYCGECIIGCEHRAKNTLDLNYLKVAQDRSADFGTDCEVYKIEPRNGGYRLTFRDFTDGSVGSVESKYVFVCAGAVNSTELLLRCRDEYQTLPKLSIELGHQYSGNGDFLAFAFDTKKTIASSDGPTITTTVVYDRGSDWFILQEGGYPAAIADLVRLADLKKGLLREVEHIRMFEELRQVFGQAARRNGRTDGTADHTAVFLAMGRDTATGVLKLSIPLRNLRVDWDLADNLPLYDAEAELSTDFAKKLGGRVGLNPLWQVLRLPISVHNLGGCPMATQAGLGVTDEHGQVFEYPGLYVMDGAILPAATGVNPSHTIAAVAERNVEAAIRKITNQPSWRAPQMAETTKIVEPLAAVEMPKGGTAAPETAPVSVSFQEMLKGFVSIKTQPRDPMPDFAAGERAGQLAGTQAEFALTITTPVFDTFVADRRHKAVATGKVHVDGLTAPAGAVVRNGIFNLFVADVHTHFYGRNMLYYLPFEGKDGKRYVLEGFKDIRDHGSFDAWGSTTTLYTIIVEEGGPVVATGILYVGFRGVLSLLSSFRVHGTRNVLSKAWKIVRFLKLFMLTLTDIFVRPRMPGAK